ncbi:acyl-CoA hydrolase [Planctomycetes bacterium Pan216]
MMGSENGYDIDVMTTLSHRLILPGDANHYGTLYAGSLLRIALESAYAAAYRYVGREANIVLRRVLNLECYYPVPTGNVVEILGTPLHLTRAYMVIGLIGSPLEDRDGPWMDGLMGFAQVGADGKPAPFPDGLEVCSKGQRWDALLDRLEKLIHLR